MRGRIAGTPGRPGAGALTRRGAVALLGLALAAPALPARAADAEAAAPINTLNQALLASMRAGSGTGFQQRYNSLLPVVDQTFDLPAILATAVGPRGGSIPAEQQSRLLAVFRAFTAASYAANFDSYSGERLEVLPDSRQVGQDQVVATRIAPASGAAHRIDYVMRRAPQGWRVVDVLLDGSISQTAVQRSDFRSLLASGGADALIASLQRKVAELSGGAVRS